MPIRNLQHAKAHDATHTGPPKKRPATSPPTAPKRKATPSRRTATRRR